jgi:hypothetical protein
MEKFVGGVEEIEQMCNRYIVLPFLNSLPMMRPAHITSGKIGMPLGLRVS